MASWLINLYGFLKTKTKTNVYSNKTTQVHPMYKMGWNRKVILGKAILWHKWDKIFNEKEEKFQGKNSVEDMTL